MATDLVFSLRNTVKKSIDELELLMKSEQLADEPKLEAVQVEIAIINGQPQQVHRIFMTAKQCPMYNEVGWIIENDVDYCLICSGAFGFFLYKYYCYGCGNVVCHSCSSNECIVDALTALGPQRVCTQCYWGQVCFTSIQYKSVLYHSIHNVFHNITKIVCKLCISQNNVPNTVGSSECAADERESQTRE
jgi:hypothetical protein